MEVSSEVQKGSKGIARRFFMKELDCVFRMLNRKANGKKIMLEVVAYESKKRC